MSNINTFAENSRRGRITFAVGGNVQAKKGYYLSRKADAELLETCLDSNYAYVLAPRQLGKTSLVIRTAQKLEEKGVLSAIIDLSPSGSKTADEKEWYISLLGEVIDQLDIDVDLNKWWELNSGGGSGKALILFFREVLLKQFKEHVVIFLDEIDSTINLPFKDDFFASLRYMYNARGVSPEFERLSFVLIGVATPNDLIRDPYRTPFNIGRRVDLDDFTLEEAMPLVEGFGLPLEESRQILGWVFKWTRGHPYLTMRVCRLIADSGRSEWGEDDIDKLVADAFFGKTDQDLNLQFVRDMLTIRVPADVEQTDVLTTYRDIRRSRRPVPDDRRSLVKSHLKLSGVVRQEDNLLRVRNMVYQQSFDEQWVREHLPATWAKQQYQRVRRVAFGLVTVIIILGALMAYAVRQRALAEDQKRVAENRAVLLDRARREVEEQRDRAEQKEREALEAAEQASDARQEAERQRDIAKRAFQREQLARAEEEGQRRQALQAAKQANDARIDAEKQRRQAEENLKLAKSRELTDKHYRDGVDLYLQGNQQAAREKFVQALNQYREQTPRDLQGEAITLRNIAASYNIGYASADRGEALKKYKEALEVYQKFPSSMGTVGRVGEATTRLNIGTIYAYQRKEADARAEFTQAQEIFKNAQDNFGVAKALQSLGKLYFDPDTYAYPTDPGLAQSARDYFLKAKKIYVDVNNVPGVVETLSDIIRTYSRREGVINDEALPYYDELLAVYKRSENRSALTSTLETLVNAYTKKGDVVNGSKYAKQLLSLYKESAGTDFVKGMYDSRISNFYSLLPPELKVELMNLYKQRIQKCREDKDINKEAQTYQIIGLLHLSANEMREAIESYEQAAQVYQRHGKAKELSATLAGLGSLYYRKGDKQKALEYYEKAVMQIPKTELNSKTTIDLYRILGELYISLGSNDDKRKALGYFERILSYYQQSELSGIATPETASGTVLTMGNLYRSLEGDEKADEFYANAIEGFKSSSFKSRFAFELAYNFMYMGANLKAINLANKFIAIPMEGRDSYTSWVSLATLYRQAGELQKAREFLDKAREIFQSRAKSESRPAEVDAFYVERFINSYKYAGEDAKAADLYLRWSQVGLTPAKSSEEDEEINLR